MSLCLTLVVTLLASTTEMQLVLSYLFTVGAPVWSAKDSIYLRITLVLFKALYMYIIYPSVESEYLAR